MKSSPKRRRTERRWDERALRRVQYNVALALGAAICALYALGSGSLESLRAAQMVPGPVVGGFWLFGAILICFFLNSLFVAAETSALTLKPLHVKHVKETQETKGNKLQYLLDGQSTFAAANKLGSDVMRLILVLVAMMLAPGFVAWQGWMSTYEATLGAAVIIILPIALVNLVIEQWARSYATLHPHRVALRLELFMKASSLLFAVPAKLMTSLAELLTNRLGKRHGALVTNQAEEEIKTLVESAQESGEIEVDEKELLHSVFEFSDTIAREIMTPRVDVDAMSIKSAPEEISRVIRESGHSRIPIYEDTDDMIIGLIHAKDLLMAMLNGKPPNLRALMRPVLFVPENKNLHELLAEMKANRAQMAIVQDEFGGTAGIVTIEDIVEELVGDIIDEYDVEEPDVQPSEDGWLVSGKMHLDDLNDEIGSEFESEEFDTVGGFVFGLLGREPATGESVYSHGYRFTVTHTDGRRIDKLKVVASVQDPTEQVNELEA